MFENPNRTMSANHTPGPVRDLHWREALANDMLASGLMIPVEHITTVGVRYLMYLTPEATEIYPYQYDPACGDCGCPRGECFGPPPSGGGDLVPESACEHYTDHTRSYTHPLPPGLR